jgi:hypothetical protein
MLQFDLLSFWAPTIRAIFLGLKPELPPQKAIYNWSTIRRGEGAWAQPEMRDEMG